MPEPVLTSVGTSVLTELEDLIDTIAVRNGWILHSRELGVTVEYRKAGSGYIRLKLKGDQLLLVTTRKYSKARPDLDSILDYLRGEI